MDCSNDATGVGNAVTDVGVCNIPRLDFPVGSGESSDERLNAAAIVVRNDDGYDSG
jgi:hypothetical protein